MKQFINSHGAIIAEDQVIREFVEQDFYVSGELELLKARVDRLTELLSHVGTQATLDYAINDLRLKEVKF